MLKWDGSDLTKFLNMKDVYWEEAIYKNLIIWRIYHNNKEELCYVRSSSSSLSCLIDEFKPIFNIEKIGTHWFKYKSKKLILLKPNVRGGKIIQEISLHEIHTYDEKFKILVKRVLLFREIMGISRSNEKGIICRVNNRSVKPLSFYEPNMYPNKNTKVLSNKILNEWFEGDLEKSLKEFFSIRYSKDITTYIFKLRIKMEKIIYRLDRKYIPYIDFILARIQSRLLQIL